MAARTPRWHQSYPMGVFSEYGERTLESLLWELAETVQDEERAVVLAAMNAARTRRDIEAEIETRMAREPNLKCKFILRSYKELDTVLSLDRWNISRAEMVLADDSHFGEPAPGRSCQCLVRPSGERARKRNDRSASAEARVDAYRTACYITRYDGRRRRISDCALSRRSPLRVLPTARENGCSAVGCGGARRTRPGRCRPRRRRHQATHCSEGTGQVRLVFDSIFGSAEAQI